MKEIPDSFIFFFRTVGLMRGLCASLDVELPILDLMAVYARQALIQDSMSRVVQRPIPSSNCVVHHKYLKILTQLVNEGKCVGVQLCVLDDKSPSNVFVNVAAGYCGSTNAQPCTTTTKFPILGLSTLPLLLIVRALVDKGMVDVNASAKEAIPQLFDPKSAPASNRDTTLGQILSHAAGYSGALPPKLTLSAPDIINWHNVRDVVKKKVADAVPPKRDLDEEYRHLLPAADHGLVQGWLLAELVLQQTMKAEDNGTDYKSQAPEDIQKYSKRVRDILSSAYDLHVRKSLSPAAAAAASWLLPVEVRNNSEAGKEENEAILSNHMIREAKQMAKDNGIELSDANGTDFFGGAVLGFNGGGGDDTSNKKSMLEKESLPESESSSDGGFSSLFQNYVCDFGLVSVLPI